MLRKYNRNQLRKYEASSSKKYVTWKDVRDVFRALEMLSSQVVEDYGEKVASTIACQSGFGFVNYRNASARCTLPKTCLELATKFEPEEAAKALEKEWNQRIKEYVAHIKKRYSTWNDAVSNGADYFGLTIVFRWYDSKDTRNAMTFEYVLDVTFDEFDVDVVDLRSSEGEDIVNTADLEYSALNDLAAEVASKKESRVLRYRRKF